MALANPLPEARASQASRKWRKWQEFGSQNHSALPVAIGAFAQNLVDNWATSWYGYQRSGAIQIEFACSNKLRHLGPSFGLVLSEGMPGI
jgi:hypothetical protein